MLLTDLASGIAGVADENLEGLFPPPWQLVSAPAPIVAEPTAGRIHARYHQVLASDAHPTVATAFLASAPLHVPPGSSHLCLQVPSNCTSRDACFSPRLTRPRPLQSSYLASEVANGQPWVNWHSPRTPGQDRVSTTRPGHGLVSLSYKDISSRSWHRIPACRASAGVAAMQPEPAEVMACR